MCQPYVMQEIKNHITYNALEDLKSISWVYVFQCQNCYDLIKAKKSKERNANVDVIFTLKKQSKAKESKRWVEKRYSIVRKYCQLICFKERLTKVIIVCINIDSH